jgi:hydrogenase/urease accessory protein HupE
MLLVLGLFFARGDAVAHDVGAMGYGVVSIHGGTVRLNLTLGVDALGLDVADARIARLAEEVARRVEIAADGRRCEPVPGTVIPPSPERASVVVIVDYACVAPVHELAIRDGLPEMLGSRYHTLLSVEAPGAAQQYVLEAERPEARIPVLAGAPADRPAGAGILAFFRLGVEHILSGFDHLLFVFALILRGGSLASIFAIVTAFTVAHSVTLALAVLDVVTLPPRFVEPVIALSIVYVAAENIFFERAASRRWLVGFVFGLVHGFGFAGGLLELDLPADALIGSLVSFNLGVEAGQAMVIAALAPLLAALRRFAWEPRAVAVLSSLVLVAGLTLLVDRALFAPS